MDEDFIPSWAIGKANGKLVVGAQLATRDGRRTGNAHIISVEVFGMLPLPWYSLLTDAGNIMVLSEGEVLDMFHPPDYVSDVDEVVKKFFRNDGQ